MTVIIAATNHNHTIIAADRRISDTTTGRYWDSPHNTKIAKHDDLMIGVAGDQPILQHIMYGWQPPSERAYDHDLAMHTQILPSLLEHIGDIDGEWEAIITIRHTIYVVDKTGFTHDDNHPYAAIGSGAGYALGYMTSHIDQDLAINEGVLGAAIIAAADFNNNVSSTFGTLTYVQPRK